MSVKILVIDNHGETLDLISLTLTRQGFQAITAISGPEGIALAERERPQLILLDLMMPEMDGFEVCRRLRAKPGLSETPIIMFTAMSRPEDKLAGFAAGADDFIVKPTRPRELLRRVTAILAQSGHEVTESAPLAPRPPAAAPAEPAQPATPPPSPPIPEPPSVTLETNAPPASLDWSDTLRPLPTPPVEWTGPYQLITVLGACGGVGTTTTAINLAASLADIGQMTTLVDLDMEQGHVAMHLGWKKAGGLNALAGASEAQWKNQLDKALIVYGNHLSLLLAQPNLSQEAPVLSVSETMRLLESLQAMGRTVVADLGRGLSPTSLAVLNEATQIVLCLRPDRVAFVATKQLVEYLRHTAGIVAPFHLLLLSFHGQSSFPLPVIEDFVGHPILDEINLDVGNLTRAVNKGTPLIRLFEGDDVAARFRRLAHQFVPV